MSSGTIIVVVVIVEMVLVLGIVLYNLIGRTDTMVVIVIVVVGGMTARAFLMVSGNPGVDGRSGQPGSVSPGSGKIVNLSNVGEFNAGHGGHGLGGGGQGGGFGAGGGRATCFIGALLPIVIWS